MSAPLLQALKALEGRLSFHMPGHKGRADMLKPDICMDATELDVTDDLYRAEGPIARAQELAAASARAAHTIFLTNGSTCGVEAMLGYAARPGGRVIMSRASHMSAVSACALYGLEPVWVDAWADEGGAPFTRPEDVIAAIRANPDARAVLVTRPDYFGRLMPLGGIARAAHAAGMLLLVDEAHGAHLNWLNAHTGVYMPGESGVGSVPEHVNALDMGADICVQSAHKTLTALTGGAYLHMGAGVDATRLLRYVALTQSSSPSFLIMASLDSARDHMDRCGAAELDRLCQMCEEVCADCLPQDMTPAREYFLAPCDRTRLAIDVSGRGISGYAAQAALTARGIDIEMADARRIVMICSPADTPADFAVLRDALAHLPRGNGGRTPPSARRIECVARRMGLREAALGETERVPLELAAGRVASRALGAYPPGVAECVPGEEISRAACERLLDARRAGASLFGLEDGLCVVTK